MSNIHTLDYSAIDSILDTMDYDGLYALATDMLNVMDNAERVYHAQYVFDECIRRYKGIKYGQTFESALEAGRYEVRIRRFKLFGV